MHDKKGLLGNSFSIVARNKRYIFWFWLLSVLLAGFGTAGFRESAHAILDRSLYGRSLRAGLTLKLLLCLDPLSALNQQGL